MDVPAQARSRLAPVAGPWRIRGAYALGALGPIAVALLLGLFREDLSHALIAFALLTPIVAAAWLAGLGPGIVGAVVGSALFNYVFIPPYGTFSVDRPEYVAVLVGFAVVATIISFLVARAQERAATAEAREAEIRVLYELSRDLADDGGSSEGLARVLARTAERFGFVSAVVRPPGVEDPDDAPLPRFTLDVGPDELGMLVLVGDRAPLSATESRVLRTFADQLALTLQAQRLEDAAREAEVLQRTDALRRSLLAAASHELKSPVAAITAAVTDLLDRGEAAQPGEIADVLEDVRASTGRLEQLITNLLDMSRIESGTLVAKVRTVDLSDTVPPAVGSVISRWPDVDIGAEVPTDAVVRGDPVFVERVVVNLLENAARSVRAGRDRRVTLSTARAGSDVVVRVADHGPGLRSGGPRAAVHPLLPAGGAVDSAGCRSRARDLQGLRRGDARHDLDGGDAGRRRDVRLPAARGMSQRVLVVDDEPQILRAVERALRARGYEVVTAGDGRAAVAEVGDAEPDLVVLDLNLPHMDGLTACREIRRSSKVPILVLSVRESEEDKVAALDLGADDYLTKPFGTAELLARVRALLRRSGGESEGRRFTLEDTEIDVDARRVRRGGKELRLTATEWKLVDALASQPGKLRTHDWLLDRVWGPGYDLDVLRVFVSQLRRKLEPDARQPRIVETDPGVGYRWLLEPDTG